MILLDTNIVSEIAKPHCDPAVVAWLGRHHETDFYICTPVLAELLQGARFLPEGRRRNELLSFCKRLESETFAARILAFDNVAAHRLATLRAVARAAGKPLRTMDALIAAIAAAHGMSLATRNISDFEALGLPLVNPFEFRGE